MIQVTRNGTKTQIQVESGYPLQSGYYYFNYDCGNEEFARLLADHFERKLIDRIDAIRKEEYNRGYKDGRAKRAKATWFAWFNLGQYK